MNGGTKHTILSATAALAAGIALVGLAVPSAHADATSTQRFQAAKKGKPKAGKPKAGKPKAGKPKAGRSKAGKLVRVTARPRRGRRARIAARTRHRAARVRRDTVAPETRITAGPAWGATVDLGSVSFSFRGTDAVGVRGYECLLDDAAWRKCLSPAGWWVGVGDHVFAVRAYDRAGNRDPTPAQRRFTVQAAAVAEPEPQREVRAESAPPQPPVICDRFAAADGSDANTGTTTDPVASPSRLVALLAAGQTGCLRAGTYALEGQDLSISSANITLASAPGETATLVGRVRILPGADGVTLRGLVLNGRNTLGANGSALPSPLVLAHAATITENEITNDHTGICVNIGAQSWANHPVSGVVISRNRIHDCGVRPSTNQHHGIYVENTRGARIVGNTIYDNADRGIQIYPEAMNTVVEGNIIDGNGSGIIFGGEGGSAASGNTVRYNVITNSRVRALVESWWAPGNPVGTGNVVSHNCLHGGATANVDRSSGGFAAVDNRFSDPLYVNRAARDYRLVNGSPCASWLEAGRSR